MYKTNILEWPLDFKTKKGITAFFKGVSDQ